jgi:hypothetical protein
MLSITSELSALLTVCGLLAVEDAKDVSPEYSALSVLAPAVAMVREQAPSPLTREAVQDPAGSPLPSLIVMVPVGVPAVELT